MESKTNKPKKPKPSFIDTETRLVVARGGVKWVGEVKITNSSWKISKSRASGVQ